MDLDTFMSKVVKAEDGCWVWAGRRTHDGYGVATVKKSTLYVHRWSQEQFNGPVPDGFQVDHLCSNASCVNPEHLEPVTPEENMRRASERITECKRGHPYTVDNTYIQKGTGRKSCKTCRKAAYAMFMEKNPGYHRGWKAKRGGSTDEES